MQRDDSGMFKMFYTPRFAVIFFWVGALFCVVAALAQLIVIVKNPPDSVLPGLLLTFGCLFGVIAWRIVCEFIAIVFQIHLELMHTRQELREHVARVIEAQEPAGESVEWPTPSAEGEGLVEPIEGYPLRFKDGKRVP